VDDFALRRGHVYGTVVVDMISGRPVDLLPDRDTASLAAWLRAHPGVEVICRDRAGAYAEAARLGAPAAVQVADRWHLWHNLAGHLERTVLSHRRCLRELPHPDEADRATADEVSAAEDPEQSEPVLGPVRELPIVARTRERHQAITELRAKGASISAIARALGLDRTTVRRFAQASGLEELQAKTLQRASLLDGYTEPAPALGRGLHRCRRPHHRDHRTRVSRQPADRAPLPTPAARRAPCPARTTCGAHGS
jgi:hypothetical protein